MIRVLFKILYVIFWLLLLRLVVRAVARALAAAPARPRAQAAPPQVRAPEDLVLDPVCRTHVPHTVSHPILTHLPLAAAMDEILESRKVLEAELKTEIRLFAYPNGGRGDFNEPLKKAIEEAGFLCALTSIRGLNGVGTDPYELRRINIWDADPALSALKLGWYKLCA